MGTALEKPQFLLTLEGERDALLREIAKTTVETEEERVQAADWLARVRSFLKAAEDRRKQLVGPLNDQVKAINTAFTGALTTAKQAETNLDKGISAFWAHQKDLERKEQARLVKLAEKRAVRAEEKGEPSPIPEVIPAIARAPERVTVTEAGKVGMVGHMKWRWADQKQIVKATSKLPDDFWVPDEVRIGKMVRAGTPQSAFNGAIIIWEEFGTSVRR